MSPKSETPATTSTPELAGEVISDAMFAVWAASGSLSGIIKNRLSPEQLQELVRGASDIVKASPFLIGCLEYGMPLAEVERRAQRAMVLKEAFSSSPFYAERAKKNPDYWHEFYTGRVNW